MIRNRQNRRHTMTGLSKTKGMEEGHADDKRVNDTALMIVDDSSIE